MPNYFDSISAVLFANGASSVYTSSSAAATFVFFRVHRALPMWINPHHPQLSYFEYLVVIYVLAFVRLWHWTGVDSFHSALISLICAPHTDYWACHLGFVSVMTHLHYCSNLMRSLATDWTGSPQAIHSFTCLFNLLRGSRNTHLRPQDD